MKKANWIYISFVCITIIVNVLPIMNVNKIDYVTGSNNVIDTTKNVYLDDRGYYDSYNLEITEDNNYLITANHGDISCWTFKEVCPRWNSDKFTIRLIDENQNELWTIGGYGEDIIYNGDMIAPYTATQLLNGNFVALSESKSIESNMFDLSLVMIDEQGDIIDNLILDIMDYDYLNYNLGSENYEISATSDGGFVIKIMDLFRGSAIVKLDENMNEEWHIKYDDTTEGAHFGIDISDYTDTILTDQDSIYVVVDDVIYSYSFSGELNWIKDLKFSIRNIALINDDLMIEGIVVESVSQQDNILKISDDSVVVYTFKTVKLSSNNGNNQWENNYYIKATSSPKYRFMGIVIDEQNNYYTVVRAGSRYDDNYLLFIKNSNDGVYLGYTVSDYTFDVYDTFTESWYYLDEMYFKVFFETEESVLKIHSPRTSMYRVTDLSDLNVVDEMPLNFTPSFINGYILFRVVLNWIAMISSLAYGGFYYYKNNIRQKK